MTPRKLTKVIGYLTLGVAGLVGSCYFAATGIPNLQAPVQVEEGGFLADGGSFHIVLRDAQGKRFAIGARGSLGVPRSEHLLYTQRWWPYFPIPTLVTRGSESEQDLRRGLRDWLGQTGHGHSGSTALVYLDAVLQDRASTQKKN